MCSHAHVDTKRIGRGRKGIYRSRQSRIDEQGAGTILSAIYREENGRRETLEREKGRVIKWKKRDIKEDMKSERKKGWGREKGYFWGIEYCFCEAI